MTGRLKSYLQHAWTCDKVPVLRIIPEPHIEYRCPDLKCSCGLDDVLGATTRITDHRYVSDPHEDECQFVNETRCSRPKADHQEEP